MSPLRILIFLAVAAFARAEAVPIKSLSVTLNRNIAPVSLEAFSGSPINIVGTLPTGQDFTGLVSIQAELHSSLSNSQDPLAVSDDLQSLPTGSTVTLSFGTAKMNRATGKYYISIYAIYAASRMEVFRVAEIRLVEAGTSQLTPPAPAPALYATLAAMAAETSARATADATLTTSLASEATTRGNADTALSSRATALETVTALNARLIQWTNSGAYTLISGTRNADNILTVGTIQWPDQITGTFTTTTLNTDPPAINAFTITYAGAVTKTVTQAAMTRNADGAVTAQPMLTITP